MRGKPENPPKLSVENQQSAMHSAAMRGYEECLAARAWIRNVRLMTLSEDL
jgi:hypothetical protein